MKDSATTAHPIVAPKKLIEVALPLDEINAAAVHEKSIRQGNPSTLHLWWSRKPLAAARAVLFAQLVNDPAWKYSEEEQKKPQIKGAITKKRNELFKLITQLVQWENTNNEDVLQKARSAIRESWRETCEANKNHPEAKTLFNSDELPLFHDPFAGGGTIPLEAQRLGLEAHGTDLNPVAVLINKAMIEIPPKFSGVVPLGPVPPAQKQTKAKATENWSGAWGLAEDVRRYGAWMREEASRRIGHLYPKVRITKEIVKNRPDLKMYEGKELTVIAWLWVRSVVSPNPAAYGVHIPLASSFQLSSHLGAWAVPVIDHKTNRWEFKIQITDKEPEIRGTVTRQGATCVMTQTHIPFSYIREQAKMGQMKSCLMATVVEGTKGRIYLDPTPEMMEIAMSADPVFVPETDLPEKALGFRIQEYGILKHKELFTKRQLVALSTFCDLVSEARQDLLNRASQQGRKQGTAFVNGGTDAIAYADAVAIFLSFLVAAVSDDLSAIVTWRATHGTGATRSTFARQAIPMMWDYAEANPFAKAAGDLMSAADALYIVISRLGGIQGYATQRDAIEEGVKENSIISTDPPYYDNIGYADLSDYFYVWHRKCLKSILPELMASILVPKSSELIASPFRHENKDGAERFFLQGMQRALSNMRNSNHSFPITIYYAFKQSETNESKETSSTGWEVFLEAIIRSGLSVSATWPIRTERSGRSRDIGSNALASSIVLVCRKRGEDAKAITRREFLRELAEKLPPALREMTDDVAASIAPVDLAQSAIGPGMAIFSKYKAVLEADGSPMSVHSALIHINKAIDDYFAQAEGDMDADTRFCIGWFQQYEYEVGPFGQADVLARAKGTSVEGVRDAGVIHAAKGEVRLLRVKEYPASWDPTKDSRLPIWEACHQMCRALGESESEAGALLARMPDKQDAIRQLAYRLYTICERKGWAEDARAYNELVTSWPAIVEQSLKAGHKGSQMTLL